MKRTEIILIRTVLILVVWILCIYRFYSDFDHHYLLESFVHAGFLILASVVSLICIYKDLKEYKLHKSKGAFISVTLTLLAVISLYWMLDRLKEQDRTPVMIHAFRGALEPESFSIDFRKNGTYKCGKGRFLGNHHYMRGRYTIKDSFLILDRSNLYNQIISNRLLIKSIPKADSLKKQGFLGKLLGLPKPDTTAKTYLFQLDHQGETIPSALVLTVN